MVYAIGLIGGFVSGFFGAGGGLIMLPALVRIAKVDVIKARGTTLASILIAVLIASIYYSKMNYIQISMSIQVALGGIIGGMIGAKVVEKIPKNILSIVFDLFLLYAALRMVF